MSENQNPGQPVDPYGTPAPKPQQVPETPGVPEGYDQPAQAPFQPTAYQAPAEQAPPGYQVPPAYQAPAEQAPPYQGQPYPQQQGYQQPAPYQGQPGYGQAPYAVPYGVEQKSKVAAGILGILLGGLGIHNFYLGYTQKALIQLLVSVLSLGILYVFMAIWGLVEGILILVGNEGFRTDAAGVPLKD